MPHFNYPRLIFFCTTNCHLLSFISIDELRKAVGETKDFLSEQGVPLEAFRSQEGFGLVKSLDDAVNALVAYDEIKRNYLLLADRVDRLFHAILPDPAVNEFGPDRKGIVVIAEQIRSLVEPADISAIMDQVEVVLDRSIAPKGYQIADVSKLVDLSQIDFEALKKHFAQSHKHIEIEKLRGSINSKLRVMLRLNKSRMRVGLIKADYVSCVTWLQSTKSRLRLSRWKQSRTGKGTDDQAALSMLHERKRCKKRRLIKV